MRNLCWKCNFRANFGVLSLGFNVKAPIPQGLTGSPNYFGLLNNLMTLIICESLREIGEMACVTSAWSSHGQTLNSRKLPLFTSLLLLKPSRCSLWPRWAMFYSAVNTRYSMITFKYSQSSFTSCLCDSWSLLSIEVFLLFALRSIHFAMAI